MEEILDNSYPYELVDPNPLHYKYNFVSRGVADVPKRVSIRFILNGYFNIGFGDLTIDANGIEKINDEAKNVNVNDGDKILNTVFICCLDFLTKNDGMKIVFFGNTLLKHRLYRMRVCGKRNLLSEFLIVKGAIISDYTVKLDERGFKVLGAIDPDNITYELFEVNHCNLYNFITFEIVK